MQLPIAFVSLALPPNTPHTPSHTSIVSSVNVVLFALPHSPRFGSHRTHMSFEDLIDYKLKVLLRSFHVNRCPPRRS